MSRFLILGAILFAVIITLVLYFSLRSPIRTEQPSSSTQEIAVQDLRTPSQYSKMSVPEAVSAIRSLPNAILRRDGLVQAAQQRSEVETLLLADAFLSDPDPTVIIQAIQIVPSAPPIAKPMSDGKKLKPAVTQRASPILSPLLKAWDANRLRPDGYGPSIIQEIIKAIGRQGDRVAVDPLLVQFAKHEDLSLDTDIVTSLGQIADPQARDSILAWRAKLLANKPTVAIALGPWQAAVDAANTALLLIP